MDPLSIAASVVGVVMPALHGVRLLIDDIQKIRDAPDDVRSVRDDLLAIGKGLTALQTVSDPQWESLGETIVIQAKSAMNLCTESCDRFRASLHRWTRHSDDGKLSWRDQAMVGIFKQSQIKSMSRQLQNCKVNLTSVVTIASL